MLKKLRHHTFFLKEAVGRNAWTREQDMLLSDYEEITKSLKSGKRFVQAYDIVITGKTEGALMVKGASVADYGAGAPDAENMKNAAEQYIIPGSSLKGALRNRVEWIAKQIGKEELANVMFGFAGKQTNRGGRGNVLVCDTVIGEGAGEVLTKLQQRIHVDRFTGGVMQTGLFAERTVSGDVALHIIIDDRGMQRHRQG